jgi:hypothetical protein
VVISHITGLTEAHWEGQTPVALLTAAQVAGCKLAGRQWDGSGVRVGVKLRQGKAGAYYMYFCVVASLGHSTSASPLLTFLATG